MERREFIKNTLAVLPASALHDHLISANRSIMKNGQGRSEDASVQRRRMYLEELLSILPKTTSTELTGRISALDNTWEDWLTRTGELPPDFSLMPSRANIPDPLCFQGIAKCRISSLPEWKRQRLWMREQFEHWIYGKMPPAPQYFRAVVTDVHKDGDVSVRQVRLEFGPAYAATLRLQLYLPSGKGHFPVFLTNQPRWIPIALKRGYAGCFYDATDPRYGITDDSDKYIDVYPDYDFACIARWAWAAMRAVDYLISQPEIDQAKIGLTGHSRNSKQALLAAAFDERIGAVVAHSGGTGDCLPWRYSTDIFSIGTIEKITGGPHNTHWFHPRLRFFAGREHKLPVDQNMLVSMIAPRGAMLCCGYAEQEGNPFGYEQTFRSAQSVYQFLGRGENLSLYLRSGEHWPSSEVLDATVDFFDRVFQIKTFPKLETWVNGYTFDKWLVSSKERIDPLSYPVKTVGDFLSSGSSAWEAKRDELRQTVRWILGEAPPQLATPSEPRLRANPPDDLISTLFQRPLKRPGIQTGIISIGDQRWADVYYPGAVGSKRFPAVVWLHPYAYSVGYDSYATPYYQRVPIEELVKRGFIVIALDQIGFGTRVLDAREFYLRYPKWSLMGKMVADTRACVRSASLLTMVDPERMYLAGYSLGAKVGLFNAALDAEIRGVVAVCGVDTLRTDDPIATEGIRQCSHLHGLLPRAGFFVENPDRLPFDFDQLLALAAPKKMTLICSSLDCYVDALALLDYVKTAKKAYLHYELEQNFRFEAPLDFNRFAVDRQMQVVDRLAEMDAA
jgi:dienelactone hydrolase